MNATDPTRARRRRWQVYLAWLIAACALAFGLAGQPPVHVARTEMTFVPPDSMIRTTPYLGYVETMIAFSGAVAATYNQRHPSTALSSPGASLLGNGLREGVSVHPSMTGNQWRVGFDRPMVVVTVSASTAEEARKTLQLQMERLEDITTELQDDAGVDPAQRIVGSWSAQEISFASFGPTRQSTAKGAGLLVVVALVLSGLVNAALDRHQDRRRSGPRRLGPDRSGPAAGAAMMTTTRTDLPAPGPRRAAPPRGSTDAVTFLTVYLVLLCALPSYLYVPALGSVGRPSILWGLVGLVWWAFARLTATTPQRRSSSTVRSAFVVFLAIIGLSYAMANLQGLPPDNAVTADSSLIRALSWAGVFLVAMDGIPTRRRLTVLLHRIVWAGALMAVLGLVQFATGQSWIDTFTVPGLATSPTFEGVTERAGFARPAGMASHPLEYGALLAMTLPLALALALHDLRRPWYLRWLPTALIVLATSVSMSRSALIAVLLGAVLLAPTVPPRHRVRAVVLGGFLVVGLALMVPGLIGTIRGMFASIGSDASTVSRTTSADKALDIAWRNPWFGQGFGTFLPEELILDNQMLLLLIDTGILGLGAFLTLVLTGLLTGWRMAWPGTGLGDRTPTDAGDRTLGAALSAAVAAGASTLLFFDGLSFTISAGMLFLVLGVTGAAGWIAHDDVGEPLAAPPTTDRPGSRGAETPGGPMSADQTPGPVIYLAGSDFTGVHGTDVQLVEALARTAPVIWVDPPHVWRPGMPLGVMDDLLPDAPGIRRVAISVPPGITRPILRSLATRFYIRALTRLLAARGVETGVVVAASWLPVLPLVPRTLRRVLYATDDVVAAAELWGMDSGYLARAREANLRHAEEVIAVSQPLADLLPHTPAPVVIPNGCDPTIVADDAEPVTGIGLEHPIAGIIGRLNERTDLAYLRASVSAGLSLLVVGPRSFADPAHDREFAELAGHPRVQWVDQVPREELSGYLAHMDVGLCAYADTPFNRASSPLKTLDYLAAGIPVVATSVAPLTTGEPGAVDVEDRPDPFAARALQVARSPRNAAALRAEAARHSWDVRAERFADVLFRPTRATRR